MWAFLGVIESFVVFCVLINVSLNVFLNLTDTEKLVLEILKTNKSINKPQIANAINKTEMTVQRAIKKLINEKMIKRVGSNKTGYWEVTQKENQGSH